MPARKRPSLKGRGAEIFLEEPRQTPTPTPTRPQVPDAHARMPESPHPRIPENGGSVPKEKVTFYLPEELLFQLELVWQDLRIRTRTKLSKSDLVQTALEQMLSEYRERGSESRLVRGLGLPTRCEAPAADLKGPRT